MPAGIGFFEKWADGGLMRMDSAAFILKSQAPRGFRPVCNIVDRGNKLKHSAIGALLRLTEPRSGNQTPVKFFAELSQRDNLH